tara:strand:+ start:16248 stop:16703 length:456 start_codon:yes stop_codon:yes gene_type:complete
MQQQFLQRALELAKQAEVCGEVPVGAVVVLNDDIIGEGYNQLISGVDPTAHAEIIAIRGAAKQLDNYRLVDCDLYVTLEPCAMCAGAMIHARINHCYFGAYDPKSSAATVFESNLSDKLNHRVQCQGGILEHECSSLLKQFFKAKREGVLK